ncbi:MAG: glycosyltransferase [Candidatus Hodarchaeales archaeon]|jgi:cellulose synthase/poly-beta-1,6-N-acetylglucosamine synthase-like glycosyltransferase
MVEMLRIFFLTTMILPLLIFGLYGSIIVLYSRKSKKNHKRPSKYFPNVTVVVPTHNEEHIISEKIENILNSNYPKEQLELIFVDDSEDATSDIIQKYSETNPSIKLIKFAERKGYSPSMMAGSKSAKGEIIVLTDAHSFFDEKTISNLVRNFEDSSIGAVTGTSTILNPGDEVAKSENLYLKLYNKMRTAETNMDSTFWFKGEAAAVRKIIINDIEESNATFDTTVALYSRKKGYRSIFDSEVHFYEYAPKTHSDHIKQKTIRAANIIKILFLFKEFIFNPKYKKFGTIIFPMNFLMVIITPLLIFLNLIFLIFLTILDTNYAGPIIGIYLISALTLLIFFRTVFETFVKFTYLLLKALYQIIFTRIEHDKVEKVMSTRKAP